MPKNTKGNNFEDNKKKLLSNPVFAMSLGSKELFHSNFWEWMIKKYPQFVSVFFPEINSDDVDNAKIKREKKNMDLTIEVENSGIYVIENKFKAYPDKEQLTEYKNKLDKIFKKGCLVYMIRPDFKEDDHWEKLYYKDMSDSIRDISEKLSDIDPFDKKLIDEYCNMVDCLVSILKIDEEKDKDAFTFVPSCKDYEELRIHDVYSKMLCNRFMHYYMTKCKNDDCPKGYTFDCKPDYSLQNANLTIKYVKWQKNDDLTAIGIQIQGDIVRFFVEIKKKVCNVVENREDIFNAFAEKGWFDEDFRKKPDITLGGKNYKTNMTPKAENGGKFNVFGDKRGEGVFIHQHYSIPDGYTYQKACDDFNKALKYIKEKNLTDLLDKIYIELK